MSVLPRRNVCSGSVFQILLQAGVTSKPTLLHSGNINPSIYMFIRFTQTIQTPSRKIACFLLGFFVSMAVAAHAAPWTETFEGTAVKFRDGGGNSQYQFQNSLLNVGQHGGKQCAYIKVSGRGGSYVYATLDVGRPSIIPELYPTVWVKSDRAGIRLFARAVLPKTIDPKTGRPMMLLLTGTSYTHVGQWQMLEISGLPKLLQQQIQVARSQVNYRVNGTGAYVDQLALNVYGGTGVTNVLVDDVTIHGYVAIQARNPNMNTPGGTVVVAPPGSWSASGDPARTGNPPGAIPNPGLGHTVAPAGRFGENQAGVASNHGMIVPNPHQAPRVELKDSELYVNDHPILVRAIRYRGESLATLKQLGFNTIWLMEEASPQLLAEAQVNGMFVICPPPRFVRVNISPTSTVPVPKIGPEYNQVLAWDLGHGLLEADIEPMRELANQIRAADQGQARPLICSPSTNLRAFSRYTDILLVGRSPLGTSLEFSDYGTWIRERPRLARPGTPVWSTIQTEVSKELYDQWRLSGQGISPPPMVSAEQIRLTAYTAITAGSRGLLFESRERLDAKDAATLARVTSLAILNMELELIRPWVAAGTLIDVVQGSQPNTAGAVFSYNNRSRLLVPIWVGPGAQFVPGQSAGNEISFTVPVPESNLVYEVTPGSLRPVLNHEQATGGEKVTLNEFSLSTLILFTEDPKTIASMRERVKTIGEPAARLYRQLAENKLQLVLAVNKCMAKYPKNTWNVGDYLIQARKQLQDCDGAIAVHEWDKACLAADRAMRPLRLIERMNWDRAVDPIYSPVASPATICFSTLPWHWSLVQQARSWQRSGNQLLGGDFEQLEQVARAGWQNFKCPNSGVETRVDITSEAAHSGASGIRIRVAVPEGAESKPMLIETPPAWIQSPTIQVAAGSIVLIEGWVHIPKPITGSVDGLIVFDSMTGESLAERIGETTDWQRFFLYRIATKTGPMTITMALAGMGEVWIDDVSIQTINPNPMATRPMGPMSR